MTLIPNVYADDVFSKLTGSGTGTASHFMSFLPMLIIFMLFWLLLVRPQQKKMKVHNQMLSSLEKGNEVLTNSGIIGKIIKLEEKFVNLEISPGVVVTLQRSAIAGKVAKEEIVKALAK